jgi:hypothetical protein
MSDQEYLTSKGWRLVRKRRNGEGVHHLWDHPDHQPGRRGFFNQTTAKQHQKHLDNGGTCRCLPRDGGSR